MVKNKVENICKFVKACIINVMHGQNTKHSFKSLYWSPVRNVKKYEEVRRRILDLVFTWNYFSIAEGVVVKPQQAATHRTAARSLSPGRWGKEPEGQ